MHTYRFKITLIISIVLTVNAMPQAQMREAPRKGLRLKGIPPLAVAERILYAPIVGLGDDTEQTEVVLNNNGAAPLTVFPTLYTRNGQPTALSSVTLQSLEVRIANLAVLVGQNKFKKADAGGLALTYRGSNMQLGAQITVYDSPFGSIDVPFTEMMDFNSSVQEAVWWSPPESRSTVILGNSSPHFITAIVQHADSDELTTVELPAFSTRLLDLPRTAKKTMRRGGAESVRISSNAEIGSLRLSGFVRSESKRYTASIHFYDLAAAVQPNLYATNFPLSGREPHMVLRNTSGGTVTIKPRIIPIAGEVSGVVELPNVEIAPHSNLEIDLTPAIGRRDLDACSVQVLSSGAAGGLIGALSSQDEALSITYDVPLRDTGKIGNSTGSYPLRLTDDYDTLVTVSNTGTETTDFVVRITYPGGSYIPGRRALRGGETAVFNLRQMRLNGTKDVYGHELPSDLQIGQFHWSLVGHPYSRLIGRAEISSTTRRMSGSFSCPICCPDNGPELSNDPSTLSLFKGHGAQVFLYEKYTDCNGNQNTQPSSDVPNWSVGDPNVCSINQTDSTFANVSALSPGSSSISGSETEVLWLQGVDGTCEENDSETYAAIDVGVQRAIPTNFRITNEANLNDGSLSFSYAYDSSSGDFNDLSDCQVGETIFYPGTANPFSWPLPMVSTTANPENNHTNQPSGVMLDRNFPPSSYQTPYMEAHFVATQRFYFICPRTGGSVTNLVPDLSIDRRIFLDTDNRFKYKITKSGFTNTVPLP